MISWLMWPRPDDERGAPVYRQSPHCLAVPESAARAHARTHESARERDRGGVASLRCALLSACAARKSAARRPLGSHHGECQDIAQGAQGGCEGCRRAGQVHEASVRWKACVQPRGGAAAPVQPARRVARRACVRAGGCSAHCNLCRRVVARAQPARVAAAPARVRGASGERRPPRCGSPRGP
jgi:hypothetical protein